MAKTKERFPGDNAAHEWLDSQKNSTRRTYQTNWKYFLEFTGMTGDQIIADRKQDTEYKWEKKVLQFKQWLLDERKISSYAATNAAMSIRGFFAFHRLGLKYRRPEVKRLKERTRKTEDYRFSKEDLKRMCDFGDLTEKYVIVAGKSLGLRAGDFMRLTRGDLEPYLDREVPISIGETSTGKEKVPAYPFIDADALPVIRLMIEQMTREGRTDATDRILTYAHGLELSRIVRRVAVKAGVKFGSKRVRFHCLRKYLTDRISSFMSESKWKQIVGKTIDEKAYVSPDELRKDFTRAMKDICWTVETVGTVDIRMQAKIEALAAIARTKGVSETTINEILTMSDAKLITREETVTRLERLTTEEKPKNTENNGEDCQRIVTEEELGEYLKRGWRVQAVLPSGKIIIDNEH